MRTGGFNVWLENRTGADLLDGAVRSVFGDVRPANGVYWISFLDKTVHAQLRGLDNASDPPYVAVASFNTEGLC